ncbi:MAG: hypothetical protein WC554_16485 [Clostridia bacterium]
MNPQPSYEEVKKQVLQKVIKANAELYQQMIDDTLDDNVKEAYPEWNKEYGLRYLPVVNRMDQIIEKNLCKVAVCKRYMHEESWLTTFINDTFYVYTHDLPHDLFRIYGYPNDKLFSLEQTMKFITDNKEKISFCENWAKRMKKFWLNNPDGMIEFG